jgi:hypothetical protein
MAEANWCWWGSAVTHDLDLHGSSIAVTRLLYLNQLADSGYTTSTVTQVAYEP